MSDAPPSARARWASYAIMLVLLVGGGLLLQWHPLHMARIPGWIDLATAVGGDVLFAIALVLVDGMAVDAADLLLAHRHRVLARLVVVVALVGFVAVAVVAWLHRHWLLAAAAAIVALLGPVARRVFPGLPRARARYRR